MFKRLNPLKPYLYKYRAQFLWGGVVLLLNNVIWIFFPQVIGRAINDLNRGITQHKIISYSLALVGIALAKGVFQFLMRWILIGISREIEFDLRNDLFRHLESLSYSYYQRTRVGDIMARATNDLNAVRMLLGPAIMYTANTILFTAGALLFMLKISPRLTMFAFLPLPAASILVQYFGRRIHERFERIQATFSDISARVQENFSGARLVRAYVQEEPEIALFEAANREYISRSLKLVRLIGMLWPTLEMLLGLAIILVLWLGGGEVLSGINLRIPAGTSLAIVGPTGSGKSTLVSLIPRIYDSSVGTVLIDGRNITDFPLSTLRKNIGFVPQETFLFSSSIRDNIAFGTEHSSDEQVEAAAQAASIAQEINAFPQRYATVVGERGLTLSGGQKQRTAIARALIRNPRILILDDALSSVDTYTEERILNHLREMMQGRTTIFISHRVSTVRAADQIAVLHGGSIVEIGTHEELLSLNGYYADLRSEERRVG